MMVISVYDETSV